MTTSRPPAYAADSPPTDSSRPPFFVIGCGRSGTTLLRTMLDHHPLVAIPVESLFLIDYLRSAERVPLDLLKRLALNEHEFKEWGVTLTLDDLRDAANVPDLINRLHLAYLKKEGKRYWGQKTPRFIRYGDLLKDAYPGAKFVHVLRDPRAVVSSLVRSNVHQSNPYYGAQRWLKDVQAGRALKAAHPDAVLEITYEDLVRDPEKTLRAVCTFLDLPYDDAMLRYYQDAHAAYGEYHSQIHARLHQPPSPDRIDAWRRNLSQDAVALVEAICMPVMAEVGYTPDHADPQPDPAYIRRLKWQRRTSGLFRQIRQYFNGRTYYLFYSIWRKARLGLLWRDLAQINY